MQKDIFSPLSLYYMSKRLTGLGLASVSQPLASEEDSEKIIQPTINLKKEGQQRAQIMRWLQCCCSPLPRAQPSRNCSSWCRWFYCNARRRDRFHHTCNISPVYKVFGCDQNHHRSNTSARWPGRSPEPCVQLYHSRSRAAPAPS